MRLRRDRGFSTLEAMVAIGILAIVVTSLLHALTAATRARGITTRTMRATERALSVVEQLRTGDRAIEAEEDGIRCEWNVDTLPEHSGLTHFRVTASWEQAGPQQLTLEGLSWQRP